MEYTIYVDVGQNAWRHRHHGMNRNQPDEDQAHRLAVTVVPKGCVKLAQTVAGIIN